MPSNSAFQCLRKIWSEIIHQWKGIDDSNWWLLRSKQGDWSLAIFLFDRERNLGSDFRKSMGKGLRDLCKNHRWTSIGSSESVDWSTLWDYQSQVCGCRWILGKGLRCWTKKLRDGMCCVFWGLSGRTCASRARDKSCLYFNRSIWDWRIKTRKSEKSLGTIWMEGRLGRFWSKLDWWNEVSDRIFQWKRWNLLHEHWGL